MKAQHSIFRILACCFLLSAAVFGSAQAQSSSSPTTPEKFVIFESHMMDG